MPERKFYKQIVEIEIVTDKPIDDDNFKHPDMLVEHLNRLIQREEIYCLPCSRRAESITRDEAIELIGDWGYDPTLLDEEKT